MSIVGLFAACSVVVVGTGAFAHRVQDELKASLGCVDLADDVSTDDVDDRAHRDP